MFVGKLKPEKSLEWYKSRLVVIGFLKTKQIKYNETFSIVVIPTTIKVLLTITLSKGWIVR